MSALSNVVVICAVAVVVIVRQSRAARVGTDRRWWVLPGVLALVALRGPGPIDPHHPVEASVLLGVELVTGLAIGAGWAATTRIWAEPGGDVWSRGTMASAAVWLGGIGLRGALLGAGALLGVHQDSSALLLGLAVTLLVRAGLVEWRAKTLRPAARGRAQARMHGAGLAAAPGKERV
ncbi:DUF1453 domain-containing protein [Streptomyces sp. NPDC048566]|uniref:DUF1453 domain-containing protein n=1 Tax=Streptomyces sp. NPDC048566 TaxID=3365569 RepID=UPI003713B367